MNNTKVFTLLAAMTVLFGLVGGSIGGQTGVLIALLIAGAMNFFMYFNSSKMVLKSYRAQVIEPSAASELHTTVNRLRQRAGLPMPTVAIAPHQQPNAFASGRNPEHAVVCVTQGLLDLVNQDD